MAPKHSPLPLAPPPPASTDPQPGAARPGATVMAASRPSIDLDEDIAALLERARVSAPVSGKVVPQLLALDVGNVAALLEAVAEDGLEGLGLGKTVQRQLCRCLPALNSCDAAEAVLSSFASLSLVEPQLGAATGAQAGSSAMAGGDGAAGERAGGGGGTDAAEGAAHAADGHATAASGPRGGDGARSAGEEHGGGAAAGGEGRGGARPKEADSGACSAQAAEGGTGGGAPGAYMDPVAPALPASGDGTIAAAGGEEVEGAAAAAEAGRRAPETLIVADPSATRHTDTGHSSQPLAASAGASDSTYSGADAEEAVAGGGSGAAEASAAATAEEDKRVRALRIALQHKTQMPVTDEEARAILQARGGRETPVTEEEARVIFRARGDVGRGRATFQARARGRGGRATASPALASKGGEKLSRRGKKAVAKEAGEVVSREEGEAIYRASLESLLASTGWTPRAAEEMAREEQRAHVRQMRWAREHGRGEPVRCFDAEEYDEGDDAFDALFDGGSGYGWDSSSGGGAFF